MTDAQNDMQESELQDSEDQVATLFGGTDSNVLHLRPLKETDYIIICSYAEEMPAVHQNGDLSRSTVGGINKGRAFSSAVYAANSRKNRISILQKNVNFFQMGDVTDENFYASLTGISLWLPSTEVLRKSPNNLLAGYLPKFEILLPILNSPCHGRTTCIDCPYAFACFTGAVPRFISMQVGLGRLTPAPHKSRLVDGGTLVECSGTLSVFLGQHGVMKDGTVEMYTQEKDNDKPRGFFATNRKRYFLRNSLPAIASPTIVEEFPALQAALNK